jgi:hypothetical protein
MLSNFHVQIKQKTSYFAIAILLISVLFASCVLPSLKFGSASIEMNIAIPQYMEKTAKLQLRYTIKTQTGQTKFWQKTTKQLT